MIGNQLNCDMEKIDTLKPYKGSYQEIVAQGEDEVNRGYKPPIKNINSDISKYQRIIIATPTWWYTMAPAMNTLLSNVDLKGKDVIFVQTHGGWPGHCIDDMKKLCKGANILSTFQVQFDSTGGDKLITPIDEIKNWIESLK